MTKERFRQVRNLFEAALERDSALRAAFLGEACLGDEPLRAQIERLLSAHLQEAPLLDRAANRPEILTGEPGRMEGRRIGPYEVLRQLGYGGMGKVYLAVRTDDVYRKPVALKVVRPEAGSGEAIERFSREREILASLDHPNLARLLDGGTTTEGLPYFVMDYVDGQPINRYCDEHQLNITERLKLFRAVCTAVEYAHSRGVVHRDLKPSNILVTTEGTVKLLDFGIAKLLCADKHETAAYATRTGMLLMTPEYASPEQVRGENVSAASDIYSLGVILYELLTGHGPYRMPSRLIHEVVRVICEEEPELPSTAVNTIERRPAGEEEAPLTVTPQSVSAARAATPAGLRRELTGDPDKIVLKALRKESAQRYRSADAFGEDIGRHLEGLPVLARGQNVFYRTGKFLGRYRAWVFAAGALAVGLATGGVKVSSWVFHSLLSLLVILTFSYLLKRMEAGREQASRAIFPAAVTIVVCVALAMAVATILRFHSPQILAVFPAMLMMVLVVILGRWPLRERWAGALLLDASRPRRIAYVLTVGILVTVIGPIVTDFNLHKDAFWVFWLVSRSLFAAYIFFFWTRVEVRQRGIVVFGQLLRWSNIESYTWEQAGNELVVLKTQAKRSWYNFYLLNKRITLPEAHKKRVVEILSQQLSEWPSAHAA